VSQGHRACAVNAVISLYGRLVRRPSHGKKRSVLKTVNCKEPFPRRRGTAGGNIDSVGKNSPVRVWCTGRSPMLTGGTVDSNPSPSARSNLVRRSSRKKGARSEAGRRFLNGGALGKWTLLRVFSPLSENQPHETPYLHACAHEEKCDEREILRSHRLFSHTRSPRSGDQHHLLNAFFMGCDVVELVSTLS